MSKAVKQIFSLLLVLSIVMSMFITTASTAFAADERATTKKMYLIDFPRGSDPNKQGWGYPALKLMSGWSMASSSKTSLGAFDSYEGNTVYCIEPGVGRHTGDTLPMKGEDYWRKFPDNDTIYAADIQILIGRIGVYGWTGKNNLNWISTNPTYADQLAKALATQFLIHEVVVGERREDFSKIDAHTLGLNNIMDRVQSNHPLRSQIYKHYYDIEAKVKAHTLKPSFDKNEYEMKYDGSKYSVTLTDTNNVVSKFSFKSTANLSFSVSGNQLTISTPTPPSGTITVDGEKTGNKARSVVVWSDEIINKKTGNVQDVITYGAEVNDPIKTNFKLKVSTGSVKLVKDAEDGYKEGITFHIEGGGINKDVVTGKNGEITVDGLQAGAKVTITEKNVPSRYIQPSSQTVTITPAQTTTVKFENKLKRGSAIFQKIDEETGKEINTKDGIFKIQQWDKNKQQYVDHSTMAYSEAKKAYVTTSDLIYTATNEGKFRWIEEKAPTGFVKPTKNTIDFSIVEDGQIYHINSGKVSNTVQKGKISLFKTDEETNKGVPGAVYEIFAAEDIYINGDVKHKKDELVDTLTTLANQSVSTKELYLGDYYVKEKTAAPGFVIDKTVYPVSLTYKGQNVTVFTEQLSVSDKPQKGKIELFKTDSETEKGVPGAVYEVIAEEDIVVNGEVKHKKGTVVDTLTTLADKPVITKELYLGNYLVKEKKAAPNYSVDIVAHRVSLKYQDQSVSVFTEKLDVKNTPQKARFNISKHGEELIGFKKSLSCYGIKYTPEYADTLLDGAAYEIYAYEDVVINNVLKYSKDELIETIITKDGKPAVSKPLYVGHTYLIREVVAPNHYFIGSNEYVVTLKYADQNITIYDEPIESYNDRQKVKVRLEKSIEENIYYPNPEAYKDVVFGIYALQDVVNAKGKVILKKDSLVDYFHINESGQGISSTDLPFNTAWYVKEIKTANGWVLNETKYPFVFSADDSNIPLHWIDINELHGELENNVVKGYVEFKKLSEHDGRPLIATYGIYRASDDMLIEELTTDLDEWVRSSELPKGEYYLAEITPPDRYHKDDNKYPFFIGKNNLTGVTIQVIVTNEPIIGALKPEYKEDGEIGNGVHIPQTGVETALTAMVALAGTSVAALGILAIKKTKKEKIKDVNYEKNHRNN